MALCIKGQCIKSKIAYLYHPNTKKELLNHQSIADAFSLYYTNLYNVWNESTMHQHSQEEIEPFLVHIALPKLNSQQLSNLNNPITIDEIKRVINNLPNCKSPGPDKLTDEYCKQFQHILTLHLFYINNNAGSSLSFPTEILSALVVTLPKPGKDPHKIFTQSRFLISILRYTVHKTNSQ